MKKGSTYQLFVFKAKWEEKRQIEGRFGHSDAVIIAIRIALSTVSLPVTMKVMIASALHWQECR